jgi:hypothetical protein
MHNEEKLEVPNDVLTAIREAASELWEDDAEQIALAVDEEIGCYIRFRTYDFTDAEPHRERITEYAGDVDTWGSWEECLGILEAEVEAYKGFVEIDGEGFAEGFIDRCKAAATEQHSDSFVDQLAYVEAEISRVLHVAAVRDRVNRVRRLVEDIEQIVGGHFYNAKIQNYGPGGVWEGEGRAFRYPLSIVDSENESRKHWKVPSALPAEHLVTGHYKLGTNELGVVRAIIDVIELLERRYGIDLSDMSVRANIEEEGLGRQ